jgi:RNA polymerase sigma-70 factor (sigma-E family)
MQATGGTPRRLLYVGAETLGLTDQSEVLVIGRGAGAAMRSGEDAQSREPDAGQAVTALYREHAVGLTRLAVAMLGDRPAAEDVVQEAFCGLYRRWSHLSDPAKSLPYVRSAVLNGCRSVIRHRSRQDGRMAAAEPAAASAEYDALVGEEHRAVLLAVRRLPRRQREALMLRYFADLDVPEIARAMGISPGTVKSTLSRGIAALGQMLGDDR